MQLLPSFAIVSSTAGPAEAAATHAPEARAEAFLQEKLVGEIAGRFFVASYQRGYRWCELEVRQLLDDLHENAHRPYCLQPVVVKLLEPGVWELVDGQQRLTTLYLLIRYFRVSGLKPLVVNRYALTYETREKSAEYLDRLDESGSQSNIDFFHLFRAQKCIEAWFDRFEINARSDVADRIFASLQRQVRVIWYEASEGTDAVELFTRLNMGRIPLDDAELFKALLLSSPDSQGSSAHRATEVAAQWDSIERDLRDPEVWAFASSEPALTRPTRITLLLEVTAGRSVDPTPGSFLVFEALRQRLASGTTAGELWAEVLGLHATVMGWFRDRNLYHKVGYLITIGARLVDLLKESRTVTRRAFESRLDFRIRMALDLTPSTAAGLSYERAGDWPKIERLLLLANIETLRASTHSTERYPFLSHKASEWSLEHIHAQNAQALNRADQWLAWLFAHRAVLASMHVADAERDQMREALVARIDARPVELTSGSFNALAAAVDSFFTLTADAGTEHGPHSLSNLALLPGDSNATLSNSVFEVKRRKIIELDREGRYIPVCTRHVFLKYFPGADDGHMHFWSHRDRDAYLASLIGSNGTDGLRSEGILRSYLQPEEHVQ